MCGAEARHAAPQPSAARVDTAHADGALHAEKVVRCAVFGGRRALEPVVSQEAAEPARRVVVDDTEVATHLCGGDRGRRGDDGEAVRRLHCRGGEHERAAAAATRSLGWNGHFVHDAIHGGESGVARGAVVRDVGALPDAAVAKKVRAAVKDAPLFDACEVCAADAARLAAAHAHRRRRR